MMLRRLRRWLGSDLRQGAEPGLPHPRLEQREARDIRISRYWSDLCQDLRHGLRNLRRAPAFAAVAILSAGLGIGACTTVFNVVNFALFRPLPVVEPGRLLSISAISQKDGVAGQTMSFPEIRDLRAGTRSWQGVAAFAPLLSAALRPDSGAARQYSGFLVTANYFDVVKPSFVAGGGFVDGEDDQPGAPAKIVLTHRVWANQFGADPDVVGRTIQVNKRPMTVVGVTGPGFQGSEVLITADFFLPLSQVAEMRRLGDNPDRMTSYGAQWLMGLGRRRNGADEGPRVRSDLDVIARDMRQRVPAMPPDRGFYAERAGQLLPSLRSQALPALLLLFVTTLLVLLTACANIANLMLARASARTKEIATRLAIGASRGRLIRQLMTESLLLAAGGGALGVVLAEWAARHIGALRLPLPLPLDLAMPIDYRVVFFSATLSVLTGLVFGLVPALRASRPNLMEALRSDGAVAAALRRFGLRNALVMAQVAISAALVICAGLFVRSLDAARHIDTGMDTENVTLVRFDPALLGYDAARTRSLLLDVVRETEALPGVRSASVTNLLPLSYGGSFTRIRANASAQAAEGTRTATMNVAPRYFETMGIRLLAGTDFTPAPSQEPLVIVNQTLARKLFPDSEALGQLVNTGDHPARIVGVVADSKYEAVLASKPAPILYRPILDLPAAQRSVAGLTLVVRSPREPGPLGNAIAQWLRARDADLVVSMPGTMDAHVRASLFAPRLAASLFALCGGAGLLIASIGVYGVIAFVVARRSREIGIRMALGARPAQVARMVLWQGAVVGLGGIVIGMAGGLTLARAARSLLYGVSALDPIAFLTAPAAVFLVVLLATAVPARRAVLVDPNRTLRAE